MTLDGVLAIFFHPNCYRRFDNVLPNAAVNKHTVRLTLTFGYMAIELAELNNEESLLYIEHRAP